MTFLRHAAVAVVMAGFFSSAARGAFINASGDLHASASVFSQPGGSGGNTPPPATFSPPATGNSISASASTNGTIGGPQSASAMATVSCFSGIHVFGLGSVSGGLSSTSSANSGTNGTITFTETVTEAPTATLTGTTVWSFASVTLKNSSNVTLLSMLAGQSGVAPQNVVLTPDVYTLTWSFSYSRATGTGGGGSPDFTLVPEPSGLALLAMGGLALLRRRRSS
jgi:hypothetical protein